MLIGFTLVAVALSALILRDPAAAWRMLFSWWSKPTAPAPAPVTVQDTEPNSSKESIDILHEDSDSDTNSTPKAKPQINGGSIPSFSLDAAPLQKAILLDPDSSEDEENLPPPQFPALNSAQRASKAVPTSKLTPLSSASKPATWSSLMPPPTRPTPPSLRAPTLVPMAGGNGSANSLRAPATGPIPNRLPPNKSSSLTVALSSTVTPPNPRKKVTLSPGHSPLDWANLLRTHPNLSGVPSLQRVTPSVLKAHNGRKGRPAWSSYQGKVYNITPYLPFHPGGEGELRRAAGKDGGKLFAEVHPWVNWDNMLGQCLVGIMVSEHDPRAGLGSPLDEMD